MRPELARLPAPLDADFLPADPELRILARLLVGFDPILADDVRDHLEAKADALAETAQTPSTEKARRYRALATLIEFSGPARIYPRS
jgi:hypothetical protein